MQQSVLHRIFWGFILVGGGVIFLLNQSGVIQVDIGYLFSTFWPLFMILFGIQGMLLQRRQGFGWNAIVVLMGLFFLGRNLGWVGWELGDLIRFAVPAILIVAGLNMVFRGSGCGRPKKRWRDNESGWNAVTPPPAPDHYDTAPPPPPPPPPQPYDSPNAFADDAASTAPEQSGEARPGEAPHADRANGPERGWDPAGNADWRMERRQERWERMQDRMQERMERHHARHAERHHARHAERHAERHARRGYDAGRDSGGDAERMWKSYHRPPGHTMRGPRVDHSRFIGDVHIGQEMWELQPMSISHFIGDTTIDLTRAQIPVGETRIYVSAFIGDVKAYVPGDHSVGIRVVSSCLIGDVKILEQKRGGLFNQMSAETPGFHDADKQVVLIVSCFIGDVRVTKVG